MNRVFALSFGLLCTLALVVGCGDKTKTGADGKDGENANGGVTPAAHYHVCTKCGEVEGTAVCCVEGVEKCSHCKLDAGSPGCCNADVRAGKEVDLCVKCGVIAAAAHKCDVTDKCAACGLQKGSALCCIKEQTAETVKERAAAAAKAHEGEHAAEGEAGASKTTPEGDSTDEPEGDASKAPEGDASKAPEGDASKAPEGE